MYEEQFRTRRWSGWWYLERRVWAAGEWSDWGHVASNPSRDWIKRKYPREVKRADNR